MPKYAPHGQPLQTLYYCPDHLRERQDRFWAKLYQVCLISTLLFGGYALFNKNVLFEVLMDTSYLEKAKHCPVTLNLEPVVVPADHAPSHLGQGFAGLAARAATPLVTWAGWAPTAPTSSALVAELALGSGLSDGPVDLWLFAQSAGLLLLAALGVSLVMGCLFLLLLQHFPGILVFLTVALQVMVPAAVGLTALLNGKKEVATWAMGVAAVLAIGFWWGRVSLSMVARLLGLSARALRSQSGLIPLALALNLVLMVLGSALTSASIAAAANGKVLPNPARVLVVAGDRCSASDGSSVTCCVWEPVPWAPFFYPLAGLTLLWSSMLLLEVKVFTVAGVVCQWYWSPAGEAGTPGATRRALRHALGPSFGSLCAGSAFLTSTAYLRYAMDQFRRRHSEEGLLVAVMGCLMGCLIELLELLTKFATVRAAMTGAAFLDAGRDVVALLRRNAMDTYNVWWYPAMVLRLSAGMLAASLSYLTFYTSQVWWQQAMAPSPDKQKAIVASATALAVVTGFLSYFLLSFLSSVLLSIVDAMYVCYAVDREEGTMGRQEVHQVYCHLPSVGPRAQPPDGHLHAYAYGSPSNHGHPIIYPQHSPAYPSPVHPYSSPGPTQPQQYGQMLQQYGQIPQQYGQMPQQYGQTAQQQYGQAP